MTPTTILKNAIDLGSTIIQNNITDKLNIPSDNDDIENDFFKNETTTKTNNSSSNNNKTIDGIINNTEIHNLTETITSIRTNVTRVLYMYFRNVSDEYGYGAATTTTTTLPTITTKSISKAEINLNNLTVTPLTSTKAANIQPATVASTSSILQTSAVKAINNAMTSTTTHFLQTAEKALNKQTSNETATTMSKIMLSLSNATASTATTLTSTSLLTANDSNTPSHILTTAPSITYPSYRLAIRSYENCSALFANYTQPQQGLFCNWTWDGYLCWPPTPAGVLARMHCPSGYHGINTKKFANRKCELEGYWGGKPHEIHNPAGWTDYQSCYKPEVSELMQMTNLDLYLDIAQRTRILEIVGLVISLFALILSLTIFCNFRSLRNNRTKIHKNLFIAMIFQVLIRLTLYLDQAIKRGGREAVASMNSPGIENIPYLCEASYVLLEYARTAMFMWMFIEGLYLHNMVTVAVFQGRFPHTVFSIIGWGMPIVMTTIWAICTAAYMDSVGDCWWNYNLTPYYWILEGPRLVVIFTNFGFLINIIRVLVVKLRQSQASDIEQTRKAVRAAIVLLPLLGITNLLYLVPDLKTPWKFALWSYVTHFLTSFQGFFIALIYCFLNGEVRTALLKSLTVYMSVRGHPEWAPKRPSMFSGAPDTEAAMQDGKRNESPPNKRLNGRKASTTSAAAILTATQNNYRTTITTRLTNYGSKIRCGSSAERRRSSGHYNNNYNCNGRRRSSSSGTGSGSSSNQTYGSLIWSLCFRGGKKVLRVPPATIPPESVVFELSEQ